MLLLPDAFSRTGTVDQTIQGRRICPWTATENVPLPLASGSEKSGAALADLRRLDGELLVTAINNVKRSVWFSYS